MLITVETPIRDTPRVQQVRGMFDLPAEATSRLEWDVRLPLDERPWHIGLIVGPSGCGKTTVARGSFQNLFAHRKAGKRKPAASSTHSLPTCRSRTSSPS